MRIGLISNLYPPIDRGGAEQVACRIVRELFQRGHDVFVLSTQGFDGVSSLYPRLEEANLERIYRVYPLNFYHVLKDRKHPAPIRVAWHAIDTLSPCAARTTQKIIAIESPDVVLTHNLKGFGLQAMRALRDAGIPVVHTLHDVQLSIPSGLLMYGREECWSNRSVLRRMYEKVTQRVVGSPEMIISPSQFLADFYEKRGFFPTSDVRVIPNPAPDVPTPNSRDRQDGPVRLLYAGQLEPHKGIRFLLRTLEGLDVPFELHIAGDGSLRKMVDGWARRDKRVTYHGFVSLENLVKLFALSDATVVPSLCYENSPTIIYESFQCGVPVIASDIGGVAELVDNGENGYLVPPKDADALRGAIKKVAEDVGGFYANQIAIQKRVQAHQIETYVDQLEGMMKEVHPRSDRPSQHPTIS